VYFLFSVCWPLSLMFPAIGVYPVQCLLTVDANVSCYWCISGPVSTDCWRLYSLLLVYILSSVYWPLTLMFPAIGVYPFQCLLNVDAYVSCYWCISCPVSTDRWRLCSLLLVYIMSYTFTKHISLKLDKNTNIWLRYRVKTSLNSREHKRQRSVDTGQDIHQ
jgi:hypothetical protein